MRPVRCIITLARPSAVQPADSCWIKDFLVDRDLLIIELGRSRFEASLNEATIGSGQVDAVRSDPVARIGCYGVGPAAQTEAVQKPLQAVDGCSVLLSSRTDSSRPTSIDIKE